MKKNLLIFILLLISCFTIISFAKEDQEEESETEAITEAVETEMPAEQEMVDEEVDPEFEVDENADTADDSVEPEMIETEDIMETEMESDGIADGTEENAEDAETKENVSEDKNDDMTVAGLSYSYGYNLNYDDYADIFETTEIIDIDPNTGTDYAYDSFSSYINIDTSAYPPADVTENTIEIYKYLTEEMNLNHAAACGILANIQMESGFNPLALGDGGTSYGICQWHNNRFSALMSYCDSIGKDYNTIDGQMANLQRELEGAYSSVLNYVKSVPNTQQGAYDAGYYWCVYFESPENAEGNGALRGNLAANEYYPRTFKEDNDEIIETEDEAWQSIVNE